MQHSTPRAFSLVELLVVVTIIVVLLAWLMPSMERAIQTAEIAVCLSNQHSIGMAPTYYHGDHKKFYPVLDTWWTLLGKAEEPPPWVAVISDVEDRPLNAYLGYTANGSEVSVARCPSDKGDGLDLVRNDNDYRTVGTSYLGAFNPSPTEPKGNTGVKIIFGYTGANPRSAWPWNLNPLPSAKHTSLVRLDNKVITMDANWPSGRLTEWEQTRWHRPDSRERLLATLFGDGHAELFNWDRDYVANWAATMEPDYNPSWKWW